jgi:hypothetical protein
MNHNESLQLSKTLKNNSLKCILSEVKLIYKKHYGRGNFSKLKICTREIEKLFKGKFPGYKVCNTEYHDVFHTLSAFLAAARILDGYNLNHGAIAEDIAFNLLVATLFHDTGYIQEVWDNEGTGAKFTQNHVERSIAFLFTHFQKFKLKKESLESIERMIQCTGLSCDINSIDFISEDERRAGSILGTADLIGQMSDRAYLEKLLFLYYEFQEAEIPGFNTEFDIIKKTVDFYHIVQKRLKVEYGDVQKYNAFHFKDRFGTERDLYEEAIVRQIDYLKKIIEDRKSNFRQKLKRGEWIHYIKSENTFIIKNKLPAAN